MTLQDFFQENRKAALAFSGGTDSAYLLYAALREGAEVRAYYVKSAFQPRFEYEDALRLARELRAELRVLTPDVLAVPKVRENPADRCYHCKRTIFGCILEAAEDLLFSLGFTDFRVRLFHGCARIQVPAEQFGRLAAARATVAEALKQDYGAVLLDLEARGEQSENDIRGGAI